VNESTTAYAGPYPRTRSYVDQLPDGLGSFPDCTGKASIIRKVYEHARLPLAGLPDPVQKLIDSPPPPSVRIPQVQVLAAIVAMVEARGLRGEAEREWVVGAATALFSSPMYRILMWAASPRMVFKSANVRWSAFFRGTALRSDVGANTGTIALDAPPRMFNRDLAGIFTSVIDAAVNYTRSDDLRAELSLNRFGDGAIEYVGHW
jgi:hypothetical protein